MFSGISTRAMIVAMIGGWTLIYYCVLQNFFKDPWNVFDFITVIGSIIDALVLELGVSAPPRVANSLCNIYFYEKLNNT